MSQDDAFLPLFVKTVLGGLCVAGAVVLVFAFLEAPLSQDDVFLPLFVKVVLGGLCVVGAVVLYAFLEARQAARRERKRLAELCQVSHVELECPGPWLGRACEVCRRHLENVP